MDWMRYPSSSQFQPYLKLLFGFCCEHSTCQKQFKAGWPLLSFHILGDALVFEVFSPIQSNTNQLIAHSDVVGHLHEHIRLRTGNKEDISSRCLSDKPVQVKPVVL